MSSTVKSSVTINTALLAQGASADASDVTIPLDELLVLLKLGRISVNDTDTHLKPLDDALAVSTGLTKPITNPSGNAVMTLTLDEKLQLLIALLTAAGKITAATIDSTGATNGQYPAANGSGGTTWVTPGGGGATPIDITGTAGETLAARDFVFRDPADNKWYKIDTNVVPIKIGTERGVATGAITINTTGTIRLTGLVSGFTGLTAGGKMYTSTTAGNYTQTEPNVSAGSGQIAFAEMGWADSTTEMVVMPKPVEYHKRESLANDASLTIVHHADAQGRNREPRAYIASTGAGASLASYGSSNYDSDILMKHRVTATYTADQCSGGTATASVDDGVNVASSAFDNNNATFWYTGTVAMPQWIRYQHTSSKVITRYTLRAGPVGSHETIAPKSWTFEGSNDGTNWTVVDTQTLVPNWATGEQRTYSCLNETSYTYYRFNVTATQTGGTSGTLVAEIEMMESATFTNGNQFLAQSFQIASPATADLVRLWLRKVGMPTGTLTLRIETDNSGSPSGTLAHANATATVSASTLNASFGFIVFDFGTNFSLNSGTTYWLVLSTSDTYNSLNYVHWGADASLPGYVSGEMKSNNGSWNVESKDAVFDVMGAGTSFDELCTVGRASGGQRDVGVRYDDGAGANGNTNTTFINKTGGTIDVTCVLEVA